MQPLRLLHSASIFFILLMFSLSIFAQSGNVGIGITTPRARLHVADSNVVFTGSTFIPGITAFAPPISGQGTRMMWYPQKAAFRVGNVDGLHWDKDSIGRFSFASGFNTKAKGEFSVSMGGQTKAIGDYSTSIGGFTSANGNFSTSMGYNTTANGFASTTMGFQTGSIGEYALSVGYGDSAIGESSVSMGYLTKAVGFASASMGSGTEAIGAYSFSMGQRSQSSGDYAVSMGEADTASGIYAISMGYKTKASGYNATSIGFESYSGGSSSISLGFRDTASSDYAVSMGYSTKARGIAATSMGGFTEAIGAYSTSIGYATQATGGYSVSMGFGDTASNDYAISMGLATNARGIASTSMGVRTTAAGSSSTSMGSETNASGEGSVSMGYQTTASGEASVSMGYKTTSRAFGSLAIGVFNDSIASSSPSSIPETNPLFIIGNGNGIDARSNAMVVLKNGNVGIGTSAPTRRLEVNGVMRVTDSSVVFTGTSGEPPANFLPTPVNGGGTRMMWFAPRAAFRAGYVSDSRWDNINIGRYSFASGYNTTASSLYSASIGFQTTASASAAFSSGNQTIAKGNNSFAMGDQTVARSYASLALGRFNDTIAGSSTTTWVNTDPVLTIGNGTSDVARSNAMTVYKNGDADISGFTKLGSDAPAIKIKKFTSSTASAEGAAINIPHSIPLSKVLGIQASVVTTTVFATYGIIPGYTNSSGYEYQLYLTPTAITVINRTGNSAQILGKPINIIITYEE
ncbi:MAG: hypothetical protein ACK55K_05930 [Bacteroidota bacterium]